MATTHPDERLYNIMNAPPYFYTGRLASGKQLIMGVQIPNMVAVMFDADGNYLETSAKKLAEVVSQEQQIEDTDLVEDDSGYFTDEFSSHIYIWQEELKVASSAILVKKFYLPERYIGIKDLPDHYQEVIDYPESVSKERFQELQEDIQAWRANREFVLDFDQDYYMSEEGEVEST